MNAIVLVAEIGCNHNGSKKLAKKLVQKANECGVDAVKFQTFHAADLISRYAPKAEYQKITTGTTDSQLEMTAKLELPRKDYLELREYALSLGLRVFSTPFDLSSIDFLESIHQTTWKIPSGEITNLPYLRRIARTEPRNRQIIVSTGMAEPEEISACLSVLEEGGVRRDELTLLHCNTEYPTPDRDVNLSAIPDLMHLFPDIRVGFSDHSVGYTAAVGAAALGCTMIEKHFTLDHSLPGPDHRASAEPKELLELVRNVRRMEQMLGGQGKTVIESERKNKIVARKSLVARTDIRRGELFTEDNLTCKRPGNGISPMEWDRVLGTAAERAFVEDELITVDGIPWQEPPV